MSLQNSTQIQLFYTGAKTVEESQESPKNSLGGYKSSSLIPNNQVWNIFGDIALLAEKRTEVKGIMLKNISEVELSNVAIWFDNLVSDIFSLQIAGVVVDGNKLEMDKLPNTYSLPFGIEFYDAIESSKLIIGTLAVGQVIGLWLKRETEEDSIRDLLSCKSLYEKFKAEEEPYIKDGSFDLNIYYETS